MRKAPTPLLALLCVRNAKGIAVSPWSRQIHADLCFLFANSRCLQLILNHPDSDPEAWHQFMFHQHVLFHQYVHQLVFVWSACDRVVDHVRDVQAFNESHCGRGAIKCALCPVGAQPSFKSQKALLQHQRCFHGSRNEMRYYADESGICRHCNTNFVTRLRLLRHLTDSRRPVCRDAILAVSSQRLSEDLVETLDLKDREARRLAQRAGGSHPIACGPARTVAGKCIGHVQH